MTEISIRMASCDGDIEEARALCRQWLNWHWKAYPSDWPTEGNPMDPEKFERVMEELPKLHARPRGGILIASIKGQPVGCVMYNEAEAVISEFNRMFVNEDGRGHGVGRRLLEHMFEQMIEDGYQKVIFSSAKFLTQARSMYETVGFVDMPQPEGFPDEWANYIYFMERSLLP